MNIFNIFDRSRTVRVDCGNNVIRNGEYELPTNGSPDSQFKSVDFGRYEGLRTPDSRVGNLAIWQKSHFSAVTSKLVLGICATLFLVMSQQSQAITFGTPDCTDNVNNIGCTYPNVVHTAQVRPSTTDPLMLIAFENCSASLLRKHDDFFILLTASHCAVEMASAIGRGLASSVAVSFDATKNPVIAPREFVLDNYVTGGIPIVFSKYTALYANYDVGLIVFPAVNGNAITAAGDTIDLGLLDVVQLPPINFLADTLIHNESKLINVGYGTGENFGIPGEEPVPGGPSGYNNDPSIYGTRSVSESEFIGFQGIKQNSMLSDMNPARDNGGTCAGDSGGPQFYNDNGTQYVVSVTSWGDVPCRATNTTARLDLEVVQEFIQKCAYDVNSIQDVRNCELRCLAFSNGRCTRTP